MEKFEKYLSENLTKADYDELHNLLGLTKYRTTTIKKDPETMYKEEVVKLAVIMDLDPMDLVNNYRCGYDYLTLTDVEELSNMDSKVEN